MRILFLTAFTILLSCTGSRLCSGEVTILFSESDSGVTATVTGSLNSPLSVLGATSNRPPLNPSSSSFSVGGNPGQSVNVAIPTSVTGPASFGIGGANNPTTTSGDTFFFSLSPTTTQIGIPLGYVFGDPIVGESIFVGESFASLGITPGSYTWNLGPGAADSITLNAGGAPELTGDFDSDGDVDADDIDFYSGNLDRPATGDFEQLDLDGDQVVTIADHDLHVTTLVQTSNGQTGALIGDANLDGVVDVLNDAFALVGNLGTSIGGYANGDFSADQAIDVLTDAFRLVNNLGQSNEPQ